MNSYLDYMQEMSQSDLRKALGSNMIDLIVEWWPSGDTLLTKKRMVSMIDSLYGTNILKEKDFRRSLLQCMSESDIYKIRDNCLTGSEKKENNPLNIIEMVVNKPWKNNRVSVYLAYLWGLSESIFEKEKDDAVIENIIDSSGEQFYELLDYQYYIKQRVLANLNSGHQMERMLVHMPTGTGKTKTSMHIIANYLNFSMHKKGLVIWIAHTTELLQQAYDTFSEVWNHLGDGEIKAYKLWGTRTIENTDEELDGMIFCGLSKLMSISESSPKLFERLKRDCRLVFFDEAHKAAADQTKKVIESLMRMPKGFENRALVGLTATPGRTTEDSYDNNLLTNMFGNKLINIDSSILNQINLGPLQALNTVAEENIIKYFQERRILSKMKPERLKYKESFSDREIKVLSGALVDLGYDDKEYTKEQLTILATNKERNLAILRRIRELQVAKIPTIIFACSVSHAKMLSAMLTLEGIKNSLVLGEMDPVARKKAIDTFKDRNSGVDIIINYEVLTTGFDSKNIRCVFITRPTKSIVLYSQMLGRGLRGPLMGGNEECLLIDVEDNLKAFDNETAFSHFNDYWRV
ncbi:DEAD/DEAH box helicase [Lachnospira multipara]|uniref:Superfamily II DNA or RNA helicase n=1 Tax=Lachnospira multipara TaxID=28051 RepID=A0A1H5S5C3_9FIRM|nr:DEAD/DEAH box helicase family protein [Lachnospira multipara]SEF45088.1 Superfamily II DNA or RNA helicase [Lachnospira multipara]